MKSKAILFHCPRVSFSEPSIFLYDQRLPVVTEVKFLGLLFKATQSWGPHIRALWTPCQSSLNLLCFFSNHQWDSDRTTLLRLYTDLLLSKLNYGVAVYVSACPSFLAILNLVQNQALSLASADFRSSPAPSLELETNVMPLDHRLELIAVRSFLRAYLLLASTLRTLLTSKAYPTSSWRFAEITYPLLAGTPPWTFPPTRVCLSLTFSLKAAGLPVKLRGQALEHMQRHAPSVPIYTDGSKSASEVGCAAIFPDFETFVSLPLIASIFTAELCAIILTLN